MNSQQYSEEDELHHFCFYHRDMKDHSQMLGAQWYHELYLLVLDTATEKKSFVKEDDFSGSIWLWDHIVHSCVT